MRRVAAVTSLKVLGPNEGTVRDYVHPNRSINCDPIYAGRINCQRGKPRVRSLTRRLLAWGSGECDCRLPFQLQLIQSVDR